MTTGQLPGTDVGEDPVDRIIFHVDMDCFYASCERLKEPSLDGRPVIVGMGYEHGETHGAVATASYEARAHGVESAQPIRQALDALPRVGHTDAGYDGPVGHYRPVDMEFYKDIASEVKSILHECAETVREVSIDEAYLDVTDRTGWDTVSDGDTRTLAEGYARYIKDRIDREVGVPASIGVAPDMATAKIASDFEKPDGLTVVPPATVRSFLEPIPIDDIHGIGPVTARELREHGIETAGGLASADRTMLITQFGSRGEELYERARGEDSRVVTPSGNPKSLSRESAFTASTDDSAQIREKIQALAGDVATRARSRGALYRTIGIKIVSPPFDVNTRARSLPGPIDDPDVVSTIADELYTEFVGATVRKVGVRVSNLDFGASDQVTLSGFENEQGDTSRQSDSGTDPDTPTGETLLDWVDPPDTTDDASEERSISEGQASLFSFSDSDVDPQE